MKLRPVEQLCENAGDLLADNPWSVIHDGDTKSCRLAWRWRRASGWDDFKPDHHIGQNPGFFAGIERVIHGFLHTGQQRLAWIVETEQMPILRKKFRDGNLTLAGAHLYRRDLLHRPCGDFLGSDW